MILKYSSQVGHYNWANPQQESISCHIVIEDDNGQKIMSTNIHPDYLMEGNDIDEVVTELKNQLNKYLFSTSFKEWKEMIKFIKKHRKEIIEGNKQKRIKEIKQEIKKLRNELLIIKKNK